MKVLLVDDDAFLRDMYATKFAESGYEVEAAEDAATALSILEHGGIDVVLLDMVMPGMDGVAFLKSAKEVESAKDTKFIVLSNQSEDTDRQAATAAGAIGYIVKAESVPSDVVAKVNAMIT